MIRNGLVVGQVDPADLPNSCRLYAFIAECDDLFDHLIEQCQLAFDEGIKLTDGQIYNYNKQSQSRKCTIGNKDILIYMYYGEIFNYNNEAALYFDIVDTNTWTLIHEPKWTTISELKEVLTKVLKGG